MLCLPLWSHANQWFSSHASHIRWITKRCSGSGSHRASTVRLGSQTWMENYKHKSKLKLLAVTHCPSSTSASTISWLNLSKIKLNLLSLSAAKWGHTIKSQTVGCAHNPVVQFLLTLLSSPTEIFNWELAGLGHKEKKGTVLLMDKQQDSGGLGLWRLEILLDPFFSQRQK